MLTATTTESVKLRCSCCGLPFAILQGGCIIVTSVHSGDKHTNAIAVSELLKLAEVAEMVRSA